MTTYTFNPNVPNGPDDPADDQPQMLTNNASTNGWVAEDHVGFNVANGGLHNKATWINQGGTPGAPLANSVRGYGNAVAGVTNWFLTPDTSGNQYRMTAFDTTNFATFGTNTTYATNRAGGWTFLPGGLLLQYGLASVLTPGGTGTIAYPKAFSGVPYDIQISGRRNNNGGDGIYVDSSPPGTTSFTYRNGSGTITSAYWQAIGPA